MNRRTAFSLAAVIPLAACASGATGSASGVERAIAEAQAIISYVSPVVPLVVAFVPGASAYLPQVQAGLQVAAGLLNTLSITMAEIDAQSVIGKIAVAVNGALDAASQAVALISNAAQRDQAQAIITAARGELKILTQLAINIQGVVSPPVMAARVAAPSLYVRAVR